MLENIVKSCPIFVKESGKVILNPHVESNQQQKLEVHPLPTPTKSTRSWVILQLDTQTHTGDTWVIRLHREAHRKPKYHTYIYLWLCRNESMWIQYYRQLWPVLWQWQRPVSGQANTSSSLTIVRQLLTVALSYTRERLRDTRRICLSVCRKVILSQN